MIDKVGIKIDPKHTVFIQIGDTLPDILPLLQRGLTGDKTPIIALKRYAKYAYLSLSVFREKRSCRYADNEQKAKNRVVFLFE